MVGVIFHPVFVWFSSKNMNLCIWSGIIRPLFCLVTSGLFDYLKYLTNEASCSPILKL